MLTVAVALAGCRNPQRTPDVQVLAPDEMPDRENGESDRARSSGGSGIAAIAGVYVLEGVTFLFWDVPVFVLYRVPKLVLWDGPTALVQSLRSNRGRIDAAITELRDRPMSSIEGEREIFSRLESLTGLVFTDRDEWIAWWNESRDRPPDTWRSGFVENALSLLSNDDYWARLVGADRLRRISGIDPGYDAKATEAERSRAADVWRNWWRREVGVTR
ncbi:MAG: hypothetical protein HYR85_02675 [Planctomycetes bacterium]|nr:hypothetical protein [Planctomycetota bacterium]MBI3844659.1 hypothetical protein [Planctomycetota bacterium]